MKRVRMIQRLSIFGTEFDGEALGRFAVCGFSPCEREHEEPDEQGEPEGDGEYPVGAHRAVERVVGGVAVLIIETEQGAVGVGEARA